MRATGTEDGSGLPVVGNFFLLDIAVIDAMTQCGAMYDVIAAYVVLAAFTAGSGERPATATRAGVRAVMRRTGISQARAESAVTWMLETTNPATGRPFLMHNGRGASRSLPHYELQDVDVEKAIALPNILLGTEDHDSAAAPTSQLARINCTARRMLIAGELVTADAVKVQSVRLLLSMYENLDIGGLGGVASSVAEFGEVFYEEPDDDGFAEVEVVLPDLRAEPDSIRQAAMNVLRKTGAVRLHLAVMDDDAEVAYTFFAFGQKQIDWMPLGYRDTTKIDTPTEYWCNATGTWEGSSRSRYRVRLDDLQTVALIACPNLLPQTETMQAQKQFYKFRTGNRIKECLQ